MIDPEEKTGMLGCLSALVAIAALGGGIFWFAQQDFSDDTPAASSRPKASSSGSGSGSGSGTTLTRVDPLSEKTVVKKAADMKPLAKKIETEEGPAEEPPPGGVAVVVEGEAPPETPSQAPPPVASRAYQAILEAEPLCYEGRLARRAPSLFTESGFAITFGADDFNSGDPLPRLEIFLDTPEAPTTASYMSMTHREFAEFSNNHEVPMSYSQEALGAVIAKWVATVATETCPDKARGGRGTP